MNALIFLHAFLFHDFGTAIVVLTVLIRLALYPLFVAQLRSQRVMQELQPAIAEVKRKYKDDKQRFAEEQMRLYKERGYNPASGCLPMLIQLPILIGLYAALQQVGCGLGPPAPPPDWPPPGLPSDTQYCPGLSGEALQSILYPFVPNLGHVDTTAHWLPWITGSGGLAQPEPFPFKILAVFAGATQLVASLMTLPAKTPQTVDPMQKSMQSMVYYFPLFTVYIAATVPAGLGLYWVVTTLFSIVQQYFVSGWGKLGVFLPVLESLPAPARPFAPQQAAVRQVEPASDPNPSGQRGSGKRRKRRR